MIKFDRVCRRHGLTTFTHHGTGAGMQCCACQSERKRGGARTPVREEVLEEQATAKERNRIRQREQILKRYQARTSQVRAESGGCCKECGATEDLHFHHLDPATKVKPVTRMGTLEGMRSEAAKCVLLCADCHEEAHAELRSLENPEK